MVAPRQPSLFDEPRQMTGTAEFSECGLYRFRLTRDNIPDVRDFQRPLVVCGLNPSVANAEKPDPTITREIGFTVDWGCGRLIKVNLFGYVETKPGKMWKWRAAGHCIVGVGNDESIRDAMLECVEHRGIFLVGWGSAGTRKADKAYVLERARQIDAWAKRANLDLYCIKTNNDGMPIHPLYQAAASQPQRWSCP